jgi:LPXTG-motif cell wall-anchored protein
VPWRRVVATIAIAVVLVQASVLPQAGAQPPPDRYALAGGCYRVRSSASLDGPFRFQATDLGRYLLLDEGGRFALGSGPAGGRADVAGPSADWQVDAEGDAFRLWLPETGVGWTADGAVTFEEADGCATIPDVEIGVTGPQATGSSPYAEVSGFVDAHLHMTAFEFLGGKAHCGRPWHPYGVTAALVDCSDHALTGGAGAVLENFLSAGTPVATHDTTGWPTFAYWPRYDSLTHEQTYYRWVERAWRGGLRMLTNLFVENRVLCEIYPLKQNDCDEMASVRLQAQRIHELERYIDAQSGGPGKGWFRIVDDPFEARAVANAGKLAVVLGIEISEPFGCRSTLGQPQCTEAGIDAQLDELEALGVRQLVVIHKFDNALGGVAFDGGTKGTIINLGNRYGTGRFWSMQTCDPDDTGVHDNDQSLPVDGLDQATALFGGILATFAPGALPVYPPPHHCNTLGLSPLGAHAVQAMVDRHLIVDVDHMSVAARQQALDLLEADAYSGVISSHSWSTPDAYPRVQALGGMIAPYAGGSSGFVEQWRARKATADPRYLFGLGFGADSNGLGAQGGPRADAADDPVRYPFRGFGGTTIDRQVSGSRVYDINVDGVAHYGLYPDWIEDLRVQAGDEIVADLARGSEAYLEMWERALGIPGRGCRPAATFAGLAAGMTPEEVLRAAGQPEQRAGSTFTYCVEGGGSEVLAFDAEARLLRPASAPPADPHGAPDRLPATGGEQAAWMPVAGVALALALALRVRSRRAPLR